MSILKKLFNFICNHDDKIAENKEPIINKMQPRVAIKDSEYESYGKRYVNKYYGLMGCEIELTNMQGVSVSFSGGRSATRISLSAVDDRGFISISKEEYIRLGGEL